MSYPLDVARLALDALSTRVLKISTGAGAFALLTFVSYQPHIYTYLAALTFTALVAPVWWRKEAS